MTRPLRADAQRNRDRLLEAALTEFTEQGPDATLDAIAKAAGVGIGTLYRHFPTKEALVAAVYRTELERVSEAAPELLEELEPGAALREWMDRFFDYALTKSGIAGALTALVDEPYLGSRNTLVGAIDLLLQAGAAEGTLRGDVAADDVVMTLSGISLAAERTGDREQAGRMLDLLMAGLRA
jgi:AcrR family transcriptional regulator